ncbi:MAG: hypothetical protein IT372_42560 [Polyangiaceae bacterium]|nr:hypothetical protein [Polyangiaceae bacterium]
MDRYTAEELQAIKAAHGEVVEVELPEFDFCALARPFNAASCARWVDEGIVNSDDAAERVLIRHVVWPAPAKVQAARRRCANLASQVVNVLAVDAGLPLERPALKYSDPLNRDTPPGVLAMAGLDEGVAEELLSKHSDVLLRVVSITDEGGTVICACVLASPSDVEQNLLRGAVEKGKGYAAACLSVVRACAVWARGDLDQTLARYPAIAPLVLVGELKEMGGAAATRRFRRR